MSVGRVVEPERGQPGRDRARASRARPRGPSARAAASSSAELEQRGVVELARRRDVIDDVPTFTTATVGAHERPRRTSSSTATDAHDVAVARAGARQRALDAHRAQPLLHVRHRLGVGEVGQRDDALGAAGRCTRHAPSSSRTTEKPCSSAGRSTTNGSGSASAARASSTSVAEPPEELVEALRA